MKTTKADEIVKDWSHIHFVVYLYICIGKSDYSLVDEEIQEIFEKLSKSGRSDGEKMKIYKESLKLYNQQSDTEVIDFIKKYAHSFYESETERKEILKNLEDIMEADGIIKDVEMIMYRFIKKVLS